VLIKSTDLKGSGFVEYDISSNLQIGPIQLKWNGSMLSFATVSEYQIFLTTVVIPLTNILWSVSGSGAGYVSATSGTPGSDKVTN